MYGTHTTYGFAYMYMYPLHGAGQAQKALRNYGEAAAAASETLKKLRQALTVLFSY